jgi:hypothetical protein
VRTAHLAVVVVVVGCAVRALPANSCSNYCVDESCISYVVSIVIYIYWQLQTCNKTTKCYSQKVKLLLKN